MQSSRELRLGLLTRLGDLAQLLLGGLQRLLQRGKLGLKLVTRLGRLRQLLLSRLGCLLSCCELGLCLLPCLIIETAWVILNSARALAGCPTLSMIANLSTAPKPSQ